MKLFVLCGSLLVCARVIAAEPELVSLTLDGQSYTNAEVFSKNPSEIVIRSGASLRRVRLEMLPSDLQVRFQYDPLRSVEWDRAQGVKALKIKKAAQAERRALAVEAAFQERDKKLAASAMLISGRVNQVIDAGLLIYSGQESERKARAVMSDLGGVNRWQGKPNGVMYFSLCLLVDHPNKKKMSEGDNIGMMAYPRGTYTYTTVNNATKTIRVFTCDPSTVTEIPTEAELKSMRSVYDY